MLAITYKNIKFNAKDKRSLRNRMVQTELLNVISLGQKESDNSKRLPTDLRTYSGHRLMGSQIIRSNG